jgi:fructan beta-fructosidase
MKIHLLCLCALIASTNLHANRPAILIDDFESGDYAGWTVTGNAFGSAPATGTLSGQQKVTGYTGKYLVNTFLGGDASVGMLVSDTFTIERNYITFLIGGGDVSGCRMELIAGGRIVYTTSSDMSEEALTWNCWDVSKLQGESAVIRIVDEATGGWGHICVDSICQADLTVIGNFEDTYAPWTVVSGTAFGTAPATGTFAGQNIVQGWNGSGFINTFIAGDAPVGVLRSQMFEITEPYICFRLGGGMHSEVLHADLYVDGKRVMSSTAADFTSTSDIAQERLRARSWNVSEWIGDSAYIEIVDATSSGWGHINADDFVFSSRSSSSIIDNRKLSILADQYLMVPVQNGSSYSLLTICDSTGKELTSQRIRIARDAVDRYLPLYTGGVAGQEIQIILSMDYENSIFESKLYTDTVSGLTPKKDNYRPVYHHSPAFGWMNDPNGMVYHDGVYHLFYQHYPYGTYWSDMHWGHATSTDLIHWEQHPIALFPDEYGYMFSGSIVVDEKNTAGFGEGAFVAVYTSTHPSQAQSLAYSLDQGMTWHKYGAPVLYGEGDFRDPKVFWYEPQDCWMLILANGHQVGIYSSPDLKQWKHELGWGKGIGAHGGVWECPDLIQVPVEGTNEMKWVMLVSINPGGIAGGSGTQYFIGDFMGNDFVLDTASKSGSLWVDYGKDNYAGVTWSGIRDKENRPLFIGWMSNWDYSGGTPYGTSPFRGQNTFPRALSLVQTPDGLRLKSAPVEQMNNLRSDVEYSVPITTISSVWQSDPIKPMLDGTYLIEMELENVKKSWKLTLKNSKNQFVAVGYNATTNEVYVDRKKSGITNCGNGFATANQVGRLSNDESAHQATILVDRSSIELFINGGRMVLTDLAYPSQPYNQLELSPEGGLLNVNQLKVTAIEPTEKVTGLNDPITSTSGEKAQLRLVNGKIQIHTPNGNIYNLLGTRIL